MGQREHVYVHLRKRSQNMHNIHTPRDGDRIRRGFLDLVKGDHRRTRKIMQTVAITKQLADQLRVDWMPTMLCTNRKCCAEKVHLSRLKIWSQFINYDSSDFNASAVIPVTVHQGMTQAIRCLYCHPLDRASRIRLTAGSSLTTANMVWDEQ
jgi:hypothetical protein